MRNRMLSYLALVLAVALLAGVVSAQIRGRGRSADEMAVENFQPILTFDNQGPAPDRGRLMVQTRGPVTDAMRAQLSKYGTIHGVIERYNIVAITPKGPRGRRAIKSLPFVSFAEKDQVRWLTDIGTWDRDILDVVDVEETANTFNPDPREVAETGAGVHVAVIDTGLIKLWRNFLVENRVDTSLARAFMGGGATAEDFVPADEFNTSNPTNLWERDTNSHGTAVASHVVGFRFAGTVVDGTAPGATIIPLKVFPNGNAFTWSSRIIAAIAYVTGLKESGAVGPVVINMSLGGGAPGILDRAAIDDAIDAGVVVVASAGNSGEGGMGWPGAYPEVISVGATGWTEQFTVASHWRTLDVDNDPDGTGTSEELQSFVATFSSRAVDALGPNFGIEPQQLDVLAPGLWTVAPCIAPSLRIGAGNPSFCFWAGTSFSSPLTAGVAALLLEKNSGLTQSDVENAFTSTALTMAPVDGRIVPVPFGTTNPTQWDTTCGGLGACDPVGSGLLQADAALAAVP